MVALICPYNLCITSLQYCAKHRFNSKLPGCLGLKLLSMGRSNADPGAEKAGEHAVLRVENGPWLGDSPFSYLSICDTLGFNVSSLSSQTQTHKAYGPASMPQGSSCMLCKMITALCGTSEANSDCCAMLSCGPPAYQAHQRCRVKRMTACRTHIGLMHYSSFACHKAILAFCIPRPCSFGRLEIVHECWGRHVIRPMPHTT